IFSNVSSPSCSDLVLSSPGHLLSSPARLAPPPSLRKSDSFLECWEVRIRVSLAVFARKKESDLLRSRIFMKQLNQTMAEDGVSPGKLGCRRSCRISSLASSSSSDLGKVKISGLQPITEMGSSLGELAEEEGGVVPVLRGPAVPVRGSDSFEDIGLGRDAMLPLALSIDGDVVVSAGAHADVQVSLDGSSLVNGSLVDVPIELASSVVARPCMADGKGTEEMLHAATVGGQMLTVVADGRGAGEVMRAAMGPRDPVVEADGLTHRKAHRVQLMHPEGEEVDF
ncbi:hypothetical protein Dimus_036875, partial [Dionaea muscipula]